MRPKFGETMLNIDRVEIETVEVSKFSSTHASMLREDSW